MQVYVDVEIPVDRPYPVLLAPHTIINGVHSNNQRACCRSYLRTRHVKVHVSKPVAVPVHCIAHHTLLPALNTAKRVPA